jgi:beta-galactosidase
MAGVEPRLQTDNTKVQARLQGGAGGSYLWVVNPSRAETKVTVSIGGAEPAFHIGEDVWEKLPVSVAGRKVTVSVPARDAAVIALR